MLCLLLLPGHILLLLCLLLPSPLHCIPVELVEIKAVVHVAVRPLLLLLPLQLVLLHLLLLELVLLLLLLFLLWRPLQMLVRLGNRREFRARVCSTPSPFVAHCLWDETDAPSSFFVDPFEYFHDFLLFSSYRQTFSRDCQ